MDFTKDNMKEEKFDMKVTEVSIDYDKLYKVIVNKYNELRVSDPAVDSVVVVMYDDMYHKFLEEINDDLIDNLAYMNVHLYPKRMHLQPAVRMVVFGDNLLVEGTVEDDNMHIDVTTEQRPDQSYPIPVTEYTTYSDEDNEENGV